MKKTDINLEIGSKDRLAGRLRAAKSYWHRTFADYALSIISIVVGVGVFAMVLATRSEDVSAVAQNGSEVPVLAAAPDATSGKADTSPTCVPQDDWHSAPRLLVLAAQEKGHVVAPQLFAMKETLSSYFGYRVETINAADYAQEMLEDAAGLVVLANAAFADPDLVESALNAARERDLPLAWIGLHGADFSGALGLKFGPDVPAALTKAQTAQLIYNDVAVPLWGQPISPRFPVELAETDRVLGHAYLEGGITHANVVVDGERAYVGFLPFDRLNGNFSLAATVDALSHVFGRHEIDPRVLFRLEDINGLAYGQGDQTFARVADLLRANEVFMHLSLIPEVVDENQSLAEEHVITDIGAASGVVKLVKEHPEAIVIVQHGFRHSRRDPRNAGCGGPGCAFEFFLDDDETLGPAVAAAFARERLTAGRAIVERHIGPVDAFEAPHYAMSPSQNTVAEEMYPVLLHSLSFHADQKTGFILPWITFRGTSAYSPTSIGYVVYGDPSSIDNIVNELSLLAEILPDPIVVVYYHPWLAGSPEGMENLKSLISRIQQLGYQFANICEELAAR